MLVGNAEFAGNVEGNWVQAIQSCNNFAVYMTTLSRINVTLLVIRFGYVSLLTTLEGKRAAQKMVGKFGGCKSSHSTEEGADGPDLLDVQAHVGAAIVVD